jgi:DNA-binding FadR family transcriptional regulator
MNVARNLSLLQATSRLRLVQDEHVAIITAIEARDARAARAAMEAHIENARQRIFVGSGEPIRDIGLRPML